MIIDENAIKNPSQTLKDENKNSVSQERNSQFDEMTPPRLPFHVLGFNRQRQVLIWHKGKTLPIPVAQLKPDELKLLVGEQPRQKKDEPCPYSLIKQKILNLAHAKGLVDDEEPINTISEN